MTDTHPADGIRDVVIIGSGPAGYTAAPSDQVQNAAEVLA